MAAKELKVKPAEGLSVDDPERGGALPAGKSTKVPATRYWRRRIQAGDVLLEQQKAADNPKKGE